MSLDWPHENVEWTEIRDLHRRGLSPDVELVGRVQGNQWYVYCVGGFARAVVNWSSTDAGEANRFLRSIAYRRCDREGCGIRVGIEGGSCGHHEEDRGR